MNDLSMSLDLMWKGMLAIFVVIGVIYGFTNILLFAAKKRGE